MKRYLGIWFLVFIGLILIACGTAEQRLDATSADEDKLVTTSSAVIGGSVWLDVNRNGIQDDCVPEVLPSVVVNVDLLDKWGTELATSRPSLSDGDYEFNLDPGNYSLMGHFFGILTTANVGSDDTIDSDFVQVDPFSSPFLFFGARGTTTTITIDAGEHDYSWDLGIIFPELDPSYCPEEGDETPPDITVDIDPETPNGNNGWYNSGDINVDWTVTDPESSFTSNPDCVDTTINTDEETTLECEATSDGGFSSESVTIKRDTTDPNVSIVGVNDGDVFVEGDEPTVSCSATDDTSGVVDPSPAPVINSVGIDSFTAICNAEDIAGNTNSDSATYRVVSLDSIADHVVASDNLNGGQKNALTKKLDHVQEQLDKGKIKQAISVMNALKNQVTSLINDGVLSADEGQGLLDAIQALIDFYS